MKPYYQDSSVTLLNADVLTGLGSLPDGSVQCCVTSLTYGTLPSRMDIIRACAESAHLGRVDYFQIGNVRALPKIVEAINQGIDSHLEAVSFLTSYNHYNQTCISITVETLHTLVRRLVDMCDAGDEDAGDEASAILASLDIEWI